MARKLTVEIVGDADSLDRAFGKAGKSAGGFQRALGTASKGAVVALGALGLAAKLGFDELMEAERVGAQTAAVIKSTGAAANVSAKQVSELAGSLSKMSGVDDEAIQSGQNMLLTFTNIRNEVGKGKDIFDQATAATLNLSVAMGKDMSSSAILVGKALNDPIKGMTALSKAGIQFTEAQKETIKTMVESGNAMGAQKLILKELETQFGGSAKAAGETLTGQLNIAKNALSEMAAELVAALLPAMQTFAELLSRVAAFLSEHKTAVQAAAVAIGVLSATILAVNLATKLYITYQALAAAATKVWTAAQWLLNAALAANPIGIVIVAIAALTAAVIIAYRESETFRRIVHAAFEMVSAAAGALARAVQTVISRLTTLFDWVKKNAAALGEKLSAPFNAIAAALRTVYDLIMAIIGAIQRMIDLIRSIPSIPSIPGIGGSGLPDFIPGADRFQGGGGSGGSLSAVGGMGMGMGGGGVPVIVNINNGQFFGVPDERVGRDIARLVEPHLNRGPASIRTG